MTTLHQLSLHGNAVPSISVLDVTPELAREWLGRNMGNRPMRPGNLKKLTTALKTGKWRMTGDPIRFSITGKLIDGQHRLNAIVETGITAQCVVMSGLDDSIFDVIDSGATRSKSDVLFSEYGLPVETTKLLSSAAIIALQYEGGMHGFRANVPTTTLVDFVRERPGLLSSAVTIKGSVPHDSPAPKSIATAFHYYAFPLDAAACERFIERFMVGAVNGAADNLLHLRNQCYSGRASQRPLPTREIFGRLIKIWNSERRGKPIKHAGNTALRQDEAFPQFI